MDFRFKEAGFDDWIVLRQLGSLLGSDAKDRDCAQVA
jgi:hypothetical protein